MAETQTHPLTGCGFQGDIYERDKVLAARHEHGNDDATGQPIACGLACPVMREDS